MLFSNHTDAVLTHSAKDTTGTKEKVVSSVSLFHTLGVLRGECLPARNGRDVISKA